MARAITTYFTAFVLLLMVVACETTPRQQYAAVNDTFIATTSTLIEGRALGVFDDEEWNGTIVPLINAADAALDQYDAVTRGGEPAPGTLEQVRTLLAQLKPFVVRVQLQE